MANSQVTFAVAAFAFLALQACSVQAQRTEGARKDRKIGIVRQDGIADFVADDTPIEAAGTYGDQGRNGAQRQVKVSGTEITITGSRRGKSWSATGTIDGNKIYIDMSPAGESEDMDGTVYASGIQWANGNSWTKQTSSWFGTQAASNRKSKASKRASDTDADITGSDQSMDIDQVDADGSDSDAIESEQDDTEASGKPGHLPRLLFIVFVAVALLVYGTDEGRVVFAALLDKAMLALGQTQALAKAQVKDPQSLLFKPMGIVNEAASVMEFGQGAPRRPREPKPQVSSVIDEAFAEERDGQENEGDNEAEAQPAPDAAKSLEIGSDLLEDQELSSPLSDPVGTLDLVSEAQPVSAPADDLDIF